jgi:hypothetical protein
MTLLRPAACIAAFTLALAVGPISSAQAQTLPQRKPGLWEIQTQTHGAMAEMQKQVEEALARMPPAQRQQMEAMMRQQGVGMTNKPGSLRVCVSPAMAARESVHQPDPEMKCQHKFTAVSSREARFAFTCTGPDGPTQGEGRVWDYGPEGYQSESTIKGQHQGRPMTMQFKQSARWLGADCQGLKPLE